MNFLDKCKAAVAKWAGILGLGRTTISVEVRNDLPPGVLASCLASWEYDEAIIAFREGSYDVEAVAAHEVLHIPFSVFETKAGTVERRFEERLVETVSKAMVALSRGATTDPVRLANRCQTMLGQSIRARRALAATGRYRMDPELAKLIMGLGAMLESEQVSGELRAAIEALVAMATGGNAEAPAAAEEVPTDAPAAEAPPEEVAPAMAGMNEHSDVPANRVAPPAAAAPGLSAVARAALLAAERDAADAAKDAKAAKELARKRMSLEETAYREALFRGAPDVFPEAAPKIREAYATAKPDEIERYIAAERARKTAASSDTPSNGRAFRKLPDSMREPIAGSGAFSKNDGGVQVRAGGKTVAQ